MTALARAASVYALCACTSSPAAPTPVAEHEADAGDASDPDVLSERVALGRLLFYDPILSGDGETACATCHSEHWGMGDGLPLAIGAGAGTLAGPGRVGDSVARRNAPSLWNVALRGALFWDGRADTLEEQALLPLDMPKELDLPRADAIAAIADVPEYADRFAAAFPDADESVAEAHVAQALAAFERTLTSQHAPYDAFMAGDPGALSATMQQGLALFSELQCDACHAPPEFQRDVYAERGIGDGADEGRFEITHDAADRGAFRVPALRNVRDTAPYFHDGSVARLRDAIAHEVERQARELSSEELDALTAFLEKGLLDIANKPDRPDAVPSGLPLPRDGFRIPR